MRNRGPLTCRRYDTDAPEHVHDVSMNRTAETPAPSVTSSLHWQEVPEGWEHADTTTLDHAVTQALAALELDSSDPAHLRLARYYDEHNGFAGATFLTLAPTAAGDITAADLLATSLLNVSFHPADVRRLLEPGTDRRLVLEALGALPDTELGVAGPDDLVAMSDFYEAVKVAVATRRAQKSDRWVIASKLCARKRPELFPVRDRVVRSLLGTAKYRNYQIDWQVFRHLIGHPTVVQMVDAARDAAASERAFGDVNLDDCRLRVLDVALWTYRPGGAEAAPAS